MPYYSFLILCYNNCELTRQAVKTLIESFDEAIISRGIEIIVVDNGSSDSTEEVIKNIISLNVNQKVDIIYKKILENMGYPVGINIGLSYCRGEIIGVLNNDLIFSRNWFNGLVDTLEVDNTIGVVAPYLSYAYGIQGINVGFNSLDKINSFAEEFINTNKDKLTYTTRVIGACMIIKRQVLEEVGGNDFFFGIGNFDDDDWCLRIRMAGYKIAVVGSSFVYHMGSKTFKTVSENINHFVSINRSKFYRKWRLTKDRNTDNVYWDREEYIKRNTYDRDIGYIPCGYNNYQLTNIDFDVNDYRTLFVADWENIYSRWKEKLEEIISNDEYGKIILWIPNNYFDFYNVVKGIKTNIFSKINSKDREKVMFIDNNIRHIDILRFINKFHTIVKIDSDFVNRYIVYMADELKKRID